MNPEIIEFGNRVFEVAFEERTATASGLVRGVWTLRLLSGPGLTQAEADRMMSAVLTECVRIGLTVRRFNMTAEEPI